MLGFAIGQHFEEFYANRRIGGWFRVIADALDSATILRHIIYQNLRVFQCHCDFPFITCESFGIFHLNFCRRCLLLVVLVVLVTVPALYSHLQTNLPS